MNKMLYKLRFRNRKGMTTIELVINTLVFLMLFCFMMDLLILSWKFSVIAQTNTQVARIAGIQGGILSGPPSGYPGGNSNYISSGAMRGIIRDKFGSSGIAPGDYTFTVAGANVGGGSSTGQQDYKSEFDTVVTVNYRWDFLSNMIPGNLRHSITSKRTTMSEWKYNYGSWDGE